jgi:hypothetical protein
MVAATGIGKVEVNMPGWVLPRGYTATPLRAETAAHSLQPRGAPDRWNALATFRGSAELRRRT